MFILNFVLIRSGFIIGEKWQAGVKKGVKKKREERKERMNEIR